MSGANIVIGANIALTGQQATINAKPIFVYGGTLTIAAGVITVVTGNHLVETEGAAASDDLDTISGGANAGQLLILSAANSARTVVAKDGTGNLRLNGDFAMDNAEDTLTLLYNGANWLEIARSDNGA